jgi:hypothetical protein
MATSSPARGATAVSRRQSRVSVLGLVTGRGGDQRWRDHVAADPMLSGSRASAKPVGPVLGAGSQQPGITNAADEPAHRRLVMGDPIHVGDLLVWAEDPHRDRVTVNVRTQMDWGEEVRDWPRPARSVWWLRPHQCG